MISVIACLLLAAGCGSSGTVSPTANTINADQFKVLQTARKKATAFINACEGALFEDQQVQGKMSRMTAVLERYKSVFPRPEYASTGWSSQRLEKEASGLSPEQLDKAMEKIARKGIEKTQTGLLIGVDKLVAFKDKNGPGVVPTDAGQVATDYLAAVSMIYGLYDFQKYVAEHTVGDGRTPNPHDPPALYTPGGQHAGYRGSQYKYPRADFFIDISQDPATGTLSYSYTTESDQIPHDGTINTMDGLVIKQAGDAITQGDNTLLEKTKL
jgi:hypothetical protein